MPIYPTLFLSPNRCAAVPRVLRSNYALASTFYRLRSDVCPSPLFFHITYWKVAVWQHQEDLIEWSLESLRSQKVILLSTGTYQIHRFSRALEVVEDQASGETGLGSKPYRYCCVLFLEYPFG
jgi:hypothetical protein